MLVACRADEQLRALTSLYHAQPARMLSIHTVITRQIRSLRLMMGHGHVQFL